MSRVFSKKEIYKQKQYILAIAFLTVILLTTPIFLLILVKKNLVQNNSKKSTQTASTISQDTPPSEWVTFIETTPYITPIDSQMNTFIYPDKHLAFSIPTNAKINIEMMRSSHSQNDTVRSVYIEMQEKPNEQPYYMKFSDGGRGGHTLENEWEDLALGSEIIRRTSYYRGKHMEETLYWVEDGRFSENVLMISFLKEDFLKDDSFAFMNKIVGSFRRL